jgi:uncharacterized membrane protein
MSAGGSGFQLLAYLLGVVCALVSTMFFNVGPLIQKQGLAVIPDITGTSVFGSVKAMVRNRKWLLGMGVAGIGGIVYFIGIGLSSAAIVEPILNFGFIVLPYMAKRMLGEKLDASGRIAIVMLVVMPIFIASGALSDPRIDLPRFLPSIAAFSVVMLGIASLLVILARKRKPILWAFAAGSLQGLAAVHLQWFTSILFPDPDLLGGLLAGWFPLVVSSVVSLVGAIYIPSIALQKNPASRVGPVTGTTSTSVAIAGGLLVFSQAVGAIPLYVIGIGLAFAGVFLIARYNDVIEASPRPKPPA